ncbi:sensor histidine kinase [Anaerocolumna sp. MB42-C2]|uniref:sensor histidine kinase n=1 Tax=Anaerocolumna sp. MB42-C2 TaxID=3070997 RepID=UPI0027DFDFEF|nr:histidine kinase [Anaerocolumna sp. MB42-C2]WMJ89588.1 histidine kinase [Anaerocolumna sp. MB42-C2]
MKLNNKFLLIFITISVLPIVIITIFVYGRYTDLVNKQTIQVTNSIVDNAVEATKAHIDAVDGMTEIFQLYSNSSYSVLDDIKKYREKGNYTVYDLWKSRNNMRFLCQHLLYSNNFVNGVFIFTPGGENIGYGWNNGIDIQNDYTPFEDSWYKKTLEKKGQLYISDLSKKAFILNSQRSISFSRALYDVYTKDFLGVLLIDCSPDVFDISSSNTLPGHALLTVSKENGNILYTNIDSVKASFTNKKNNKNINVIKNTLDNPALTVVAAIDMKPIYNEFNFTKFLIIGIATSCALIFIIISFFLSRSLTRPISALSDIMRNHKKHGLVTADKYLNLHNEIGVLYNEYNNMVEENNQFIKEQYHNKLITLDSQMKSLEAQINSHFLYNTLESINSIAEIEEIESISIISLALGNMLRYSINTESELVNIQDELKNVNDYMSIQKIRFDNRFEIIYEINESVLKLKILKLILQPLVENALYHGLNRCSIAGKVIISVNVKNEIIFIDITDTGMGMNEKQLREVQESLSKPILFTELGRREKQSIGLKNIHSRIELYYGIGYGLSVKSKEKEGTTIMIKLPVLK